MLRGHDFVFVTNHLRKVTQLFLPPVFSLLPKFIMEPSAVFANETDSKKN